MRKLYIVLAVLVLSAAAVFAQTAGWLISPNDTARSSTRPTCSAAARSKLWISEAASGADDTLQICQRDAAGAYAWVSVATGGVIDALTATTGATTEVVIGDVTLLTIANGLVTACVGGGVDGCETP